MRARFLMIFLLAIALSTSAAATVVTPEYTVRLEGPAPSVADGESYTLPVSLYVRDDLVFYELRSVPGKSGADLQVVEVASKSAEPEPEGYRRYSFEISGVMHSGTSSVLSLQMAHGEERLAVDFGRRGLAPRQVPDQPRPLDATAFSQPNPTVSVRTQEKVAGKAVRTVQVTGRLLTEIPAEEEGGTPRIEGVDGATVKVMQPVFFLDDNTLGEAVSDVNGDFTFTFDIDGFQDIYV